MVDFRNLVRYSGQLTNPVWWTANLAVANLHNSPASPTGYLHRLVVTGATGNGQASIGQSNIPEFAQNNQYTLNVWLENETVNQGLSLSLGANDGSFITAGLDLQSKAIGSVNTSTGSSWSNLASGKVDIDGSWTRYWIRGTSPAVNGAPMYATLSGPGNPSALSVGKSFLCGGFSLFASDLQTFVDTTTVPVAASYLPLFDFPYHRVATRWPQNSTSIALGGGYTFTSRANGPPQRSFSLEFEGMTWFINPTTGFPDATITPQRNLMALNNFYAAQQLSDPFYYDHPIYGRMVVKFLKPLEIPKVEIGGTGLVRGLQIELIEIP